MNDKHYPAGSSKGGQFAPKNGTQTAQIPSVEVDLEQEYGINPEMLERQRKIDEFEKTVTRMPFNQYSPEIQQMASALQNRALTSEPDITKDLSTLTKIVGADLVGLDHRVKSLDSLAEKLFNNIEIWGNDAKSAFENINDSLRYTVSLPADNFVDGFFDITKGLNDVGYRILQVKNRFMNKATKEYKDVNVLLQDKKGNIFEIQFNTPENIAVKNGHDGQNGLHFYYDQLKKIKSWKENGQSPEDNERFRYLRYTMKKLAQDMNVPANIDKIYNFVSKYE